MENRSKEIASHLSVVMERELYNSEMVSQNNTEKWQ